MNNFGVPSARIYMFLLRKNTLTINYSLFTLY